MVPWWDGDVVKVKNPDPVSDPLPNNSDDTADDSGIANIQGPNPDNVPEQKVGGDVMNVKNPDPVPDPFPNNSDDKADNSGVANNQGPNPDNVIEPRNSGCTKRLRSRGRPAGSKNKSKFQADVAPNFKSHIIEIRKGSDVIQVLATFAANQQSGVSVLSAKGMVTDVKLERAVSSSIVDLSGSFDIISLSGSLLPASSPPGASGLTMCLVDGQGQVVCGRVLGPLLAFGPVFVVVMITNPSHERVLLAVEYEGEGGNGSSSARR